MAKTHFPHLYEPITIRGHHYKNRIQWAPIVSNHAGVLDGSVTNDLVEFVRVQAKSGVSMITIGSTPVNANEGRDFFYALSTRHQDSVFGLAKLAREAHKQHCAISAELTHAGQLYAHIAAQGGGLLAYVPSVLPEWGLGPDVCKEVGREEMDQVIEDYVNCVTNMRTAGWDQALIHGAHGNLISAFLSTTFNKRTDEYGGSPENRWRFPLEILKACREAAGEDMILTFSTVGEEYVSGATPLEERIAFLKEAAKYIDMVIVSSGTLYQPEAASYVIPNYYIPKGASIEAAATIKAAIPELVVAARGGIDSLEDAERYVAEGKVDMVAIAKSLMADYQFALKGEQGREEDIMPCMRCLYCIRNTGPADHLFGCSVNPTLGWEFRGIQLTPTCNDRKVMIVGGGPAGMYAAQTLRKRGFSDVTLYEKGPQLGGRFPEASALPYKDGFRKAFGHIVKETQKCGAKIVLNTEVTPDLVREEAPDVLLVAIGAELLRPGIPGIEKTLDVDKVDRGECEVGDTVVVCGAGASGSECALALAMEGKQVTLIDQVPEEQFHANCLSSVGVMLGIELERKGVQLVGNAKVLEFTDEGVVVQAPDGETKTLKADSVVTAFGLRADNAAITALTDEAPETYVIGDAFEVGFIGDATNRAYWICREME